MTTNAITTYLKYANLQMAAEAFLKDGLTGENLAAALKIGNNRSSKFTDVLAEDFAKNWKVVAHKENSLTSFSGTLFEYIGETDVVLGVAKGELVLSFRSTEFINDAARDNQATNKMEIADKGWAFGQIDDMPCAEDGDNILLGSGKEYELWRDGFTENDMRFRRTT